MIADRSKMVFTCMYIVIVHGYCDINGISVVIGWDSGGNDNCFTSTT
jgi:hypothetical protein